jgi:hypothetical protein
MKYPVLIGLTISDAVKILSHLKLNYRIIIIDDKIYDIDSSVKQDRANIIVKKGIVHNYLFY